MAFLLTDGLHSTRAVCTLHVTGITDDMLEHSVTVRVIDINAYTFLSPHLYQFIDGLATVLNTTSDVSSIHYCILTLFSARNAFLGRRNDSFIFEDISHRNDTSYANKVTNLKSVVIFK